MTLRDYLHVIWLRKWLVVLVTVACTVTAFLYSYNQPRLYTSAATLMYDQPTNIANPLSQTGYTDVTDIQLQLQGVVDTLDSEPVADRAKQLMHEAKDDAGSFAVAASIVEPSASSSSTVARTLAIAGESTDPARAADAANAYAQAVIDTRLEADRERYAAAQAAVQAQMDRFQTKTSRLSTDYLLLAQRLNDLQVASATATGDFKIIRAAETPTSPSSPKPLQAGLLGFAVGLFAGIALAFVSAQFDTRVRTYRDASEILGLPVIGRLPRLPKTVLAARGIVTLEDPDGPFAESVRMMRSNLSWAAVAGDWKSLLITSARQGEGKSLTLCNLAVTLALAGKKVVVIDADLRAPSVHRYYNFSNVTGMTTVIAKPAPVATVLKRFAVDGPVKRQDVRTLSVTRDESSDSETGSLLVMTAGPPPPNPGEVVASRRLAEVIAEVLASDADYVLVDAPPLLVVGDAAALAPLVDGLLFVVNLDQSRRSLLEDSREALDGMSCHKIGTVFVGERADASTYYGYRSATPGDPASTRRGAKS